MKAYTDIKQIKVLIELLDPSTADMCLNVSKEKKNPKPIMVPYSQFEEFFEMGIPDFIIPCWSLGKLLDMLPNEISLGDKFEDKYQIDIRKYDGEMNDTWYQIAYGNCRGLSNSWHDMFNTPESRDLIDCCVSMVVTCKKMDF